MIPNIVVIHLLFIVFLIFVFNYIIIKLFGVDLVMEIVSWLRYKIYSKPSKNDVDKQR